MTDVSSSVSFHKSFSRVYIKEARGDFKETHVFDMMYDIKAWLKPHLEQLNNHSHPHIFRFRKGPDGHCYMQYRKWRHSEWQPKSSPICHGVWILKVYNN